MFFKVKGKKTISSSLIIGTIFPVYLECQSGGLVAKAAGKANTQTSNNIHTPPANKDKEVGSSYIWWILAVVVGVGLIWLLKKYSEAQQIERKLSELKCTYIRADNLLKNVKEADFDFLTSLNRCYKIICNLEKDLSSCMTEVDLSSKLETLLKGIDVDVGKVKATSKYIVEECIEQQNKEVIRYKYDKASEILGKNKEKAINIIVKEEINADSNNKDLNLIESNEFNENMVNNIMNEEKNDKKEIIKGNDNESDKNIVINIINEEKNDKKENDDKGNNKNLDLIKNNKFDEKEDKKGKKGINIINEEKNDKKENIEDIKEIDVKEDEGFDSVLSKTDSKVISLMKEIFVLNPEEAVKSKEKYNESEEKEVLNVLAKYKDELGLSSQKLKFKLKDLKQIMAKVFNEKISVDSLFKGKSDNSIVEMELSDIIGSQGFGELRFKFDGHTLCTKRLKDGSINILIELFNLLLERSSQEKGRKYYFRLDKEYVSAKKKYCTELVLYKRKDNAVTKCREAFIDNEIRLKNLFFVHKVLEENAKDDGFVNYFNESKEPKSGTCEMSQFDIIKEVTSEVNVKSFLKILGEEYVEKIFAFNQSLEDNETVTLSVEDVREDGSITFKCIFKNGNTISALATKCLKEGQIDNFFKFFLGMKEDNKSHLDNFCFVREVFMKKVENDSFVDFFDENSESLSKRRDRDDDEEDTSSEIVNKFRSVKNVKFEVNIESFLRVLDVDSISYFLKKFRKFKQSFADNKTILISVTGDYKYGSVTVDCTLKNNVVIDDLNMKSLKKDQIYNFLKFVQDKQRIKKDENLNIIDDVAPPVANPLA